MGYKVFLDFEFTQGPKFPKEEIISIGCVIYDENLDEVDSFYSLCIPKVNRQIPRIITKITGITQKEIYNAPSFTKMANNLVKVLKKYPDAKFYAWGMDDGKVFNTAMYINDCTWLKKYIPYIVNLQKEIMGSIRNNRGRLWRSPRNLTTMAEFYNCNMLQAHNALNDARMLAQVYKAKKLRGKYNADTGTFYHKENVTEEDLTAARDTVQKINDREKQVVIHEVISAYGKGPFAKIMDRELYDGFPIELKKRLPEAGELEYGSASEVTMDEATMKMTFLLHQKNRLVKTEFDIREYKKDVLCILQLYKTHI